MLKALKKFECKFPKEYKEAQKISGIMWDYMTKLGENDINKLIDLRNGIMLHKVGYLLFPNSLIEKLKSGEKLTENETMILSEYPKKSLQILAEYIVDANPLMLEIIEKCKERSDGKGLIGIKNKNIPAEVKIFKVIKKYIQIYTEYRDENKVKETLLNSDGELDMIYVYSFIGYLSENKQFVQDILNT